MTKRTETNKRKKRTDNTEIRRSSSIRLKLLRRRKKGKRRREKDNTSWNRDAKR